jgi:NADH-quinone oxidoreductase subunit H
MDPIALLIVVAKCIFAVVFVMNIVPLLIYGERKGAAYIQDRPGPNRAHICGIRAGGLVHTLVDVVKLITKEDITPGHVEKKFWMVAPIIAMTVALSTFVVIPWGDELRISRDLVVKLQVADINGGLLYILAITSLGVYGIMLAGWSSNNKFSLIGGLRSSAQMVSYELAMGLSLVVMFMLYGSVRLSDIVAQQAGPIWNWGVFQGGVVTGMLAFILFWVAAFAETNRMPFDLPEGEAELVAGYHTEYSSLRFALFFMAEYANMVVASAVTATLFFGGYHFPFLDGDAIRQHANTILMVFGGGGAIVLPVLAVIAWQRRKRVFYQSLPADDIRHREPKFWVIVWLGLAGLHAGLAFLGSTGFIQQGTLGPEIVAFVIHLNVLVVKVLIGCWIMIWVRWTIPRFRYDQLMSLGWKRMLPIAVVNVMLAGIWIAFTGGPNG